MANTKRLRHWHDIGCALCGQEIENPQFGIEISTSGELIPLSEADRDDSQGVFDIGPTCAKKVAKKYLHKNH